MVTPTKSKPSKIYPNNKANKGQHQGPHKKPVSQSNPKGNNGRRTPKDQTVPGQVFKTPNNKQVRQAHHAHVQRCASEPSHSRPSPSRRSVTPPTSGSPINFAGPKCLEPPIPKSLPRPPAKWTTPSTSTDELTARQDLSQLFRDMGIAAKTNTEEPKPPKQVVNMPKPMVNEAASQQLRMLLKVQA